MIDFRYHLVSLIAVFLALALGILLGAGPLNQTIGDQLTGQVEDLRTDRDQLRTELELNQAETAEREAFIDAVAPETLGSRLEGRVVAVITLPGADAGDVADVRTRLEQSGAGVSAEVQVTPTWADPDAEDLRSDLAGQLLGHLAPAPEGDAGTAAILGAALGQGLTASDAVGERTVAAETLLDLLSAAEEPLVNVVDAPDGPANATVVVGPRSEPLPEGEEGQEAEPAEAEDTSEAHVRLVRALSGTAEGSVLLGAAVTELDLVTAVRADGEAADVVTTVDSVGEIVGRMNVPLALAADISGDNGHYGFGQGAEAPVPAAVYLPPPAPPEPAPTDGATDGAALTDGAATEGQDG